MRIFIQITAALALLLTGWASASAETLKVKANTVTSVGFFYFYTPLGYGCTTGGKPVVRVGRAPEHGVLRTEWRRGKMNSSGGCKGMPASGLSVWYTPHKGYRGPDSFRFSMSVPGIVPGASFTDAKNWSYKVDVK